MLGEPNDNGVRSADLGLAALANVVVFGLAAWVMTQRHDALPTPPPEVVAINVVSAGAAPATAKGGPGPARSPRPRKATDSAKTTPDPNHVPEPDAVSPTSTSLRAASRASAAPEAPATDLQGDDDTDRATPDAPPAANAADGAGAGAGEVGSGSAGHGPMYDRAIGFYRARLVSWFSTRFRVRGSGLSKAELQRHRVTAEIDVAPDLSVTSYRIVASDHPTFEAAARKTLEAALDQRLPPPPSAFPGAVQSRITVVFTCSDQTCD